MSLPIMWTKEMDEWLKENVSSFHWKELTQKINECFKVNFNFRTIKGHCRTKLHLFNNLFPEQYTAEQEEWLKSHPMIPYEKLTTMFNEAFGTNKTVDGLRHHCQKIGIAFVSKHYWSEEEENLLKELYNSKPNKELSILFNVSEKAIESKAKDMGIQKKRRKVYVDVEKIEEYFKGHYLFESNNEIAKKFNLNENSKIIRKISPKYRNGGNKGRNAFLRTYLPFVKDKGELWEKWKEVFPERTSDEERKKLFAVCSGNFRLTKLSVPSKKLPRYFQDVKPLGFRMIKAKCVYVKVRNQTENGRVLYPNYMDCYEKEYELVLGYKVPADMIVIHLDGNWKNNTAENLKVISKAIYVKLNQNSWYGLGKMTEAACEVLETNQTLSKLLN